MKAWETEALLILVVHSPPHYLGLDDENLFHGNGIESSYIKLLKRINTTILIDPVKRVFAFHFGLAHPGQSIKKSSLRLLIFSVFELADGATL